MRPDCFYLLVANFFGKRFVNSLVFEIIGKRFAFRPIMADFPLINEGMHMQIQQVRGSGGPVTVPRLHLPSFGPRQEQMETTNLLLICQSFASMFGFNEKKMTKSAGQNFCSSKQTGPKLLLLQKVRAVKSKPYLWQNLARK